MDTSLHSETTRTECTYRHRMARLRRPWWLVTYGCGVYCNNITIFYETATTSTRKFIRAETDGGCMSNSVRHWLVRCVQRHQSAGTWSSLSPTSPDLLRSRPQSLHLMHTDIQVNSQKRFRP